MPRPHPDELRRKILEGYGAGESLSSLARRFGVSVFYVSKIRNQLLRTGQKERKPQSRHGPASRVTETVKMELRILLKRQPELTLEQLRDEIKTKLGVSLSRSLVGQAVQRLGIRAKRKRLVE